MVKLWDVAPGPLVEALKGAYEREAQRPHLEAQRKRAAFEAWRNRPKAVR